MTAARRLVNSFLTPNHKGLAIYCRRCGLVRRFRSRTDLTLREAREIFESLGAKPARAETDSLLPRAIAASS